ncbi:MAG TPA: erythromycin esterase family protein [Bacteroidetes bacterium]|nr:erythromycin esterase family protein [Bacteroidota bacterium]
MNLLAPLGKAQRPITKLILLLPLLSFLSASCKKENCDLPPAQCHVYPDNCGELFEKNTPVRDKLKEYAHPLTGAATPLDDAELADLDGILSSAYFVGMGEATHGTSEFFSMKDRLLRYMVKKHGYKALGFEGTWGGALYVNQYVLHGIGSAEESIAKMQSWPVRTEEVAALVEWMKTYNDSRPDSEKIYFFGVDMQVSSEEYYWINEYLGRTDEGLKAEIDTLVKDFVESANYNSYPLFSPEQQLEYKTNLEMALRLYEQNENELVALSSQKEYDLIHQAFVILLQYEDVFDKSSGHTRDYYMARNSEWISSYVGPGAKVALWAHNGHITKGNNASQGHELYLAHGDKYKSIGFSFTQGTFRAVDFQTYEGPLSFYIEDIGCSTANALLGSIGQEDYYLLFNELPETSPAYQYFDSYQPFFEVGALFDPEQPNWFAARKLLTKHFDVLVHFKTSTPSNPL